MINKFLMAWLCILMVNGFLLHPYDTCWPLLASLISMPAIALCVPDKHLRKTSLGVGGVIGLYGAGLLVQQAMRVRYTSFDPLGIGGRAWPMIDPNCASLVLLFLFLPAVDMLIGDVEDDGSRTWESLFAGFILAALAVTRSKAGFAAALLGVSLILVKHFGWLVLLAAALLGAIALNAALWFDADMVLRWVSAFDERLPVWQVSAHLLHRAPWVGIGVGQFYRYYVPIRTEHYTMGFFAHNDLMQFAIELGWPAAALFVAFLAALACTTRKQNAVASVLILVAVLQSLVEFQLYTPPVNVLLALAVAWHRKGYREWASYFRKI